MARKVTGLSIARFCGVKHSALGHWAAQGVLRPRQRGKQTVWTLRDAAAAKFVAIGREIGMPLSLCRELAGVVYDATDSELRSGLLVADDERFFIAPSDAVPQGCDVVTDLGARMRELDESLERGDLNDKRGSHWRKKRETPAAA